MARSSGPSQGFFMVLNFYSLGTRTSKKTTLYLKCEKVAKDCRIHELLTLLFFEMNRCVHKNNCGNTYRPSKRKLYEEPASKRQRSRRVSSRKTGLGATAPDTSTWLRPGMPVGATSLTNNSSELADPLLTQSPHERIDIPI